MTGVKPTDLEQKKLAWHDWVAEDRYTLGRELLEHYPRDTVEFAVATTMLEQPAQIPCGNSIGMSPWRSGSPWGWKSGYFSASSVMPTGWCNAREGWGGDAVVLFAFGSNADCLKLMCEIAKQRGMTLPAHYASKWLGAEEGTTTWENQARWFETILANVRSKL